MNEITSNYQLLINKLDQFIRKFYLSTLIKGLLYSTGLIVIAFLVIAVSEYFLYFSTTVRKILFYGFLSLSGITAVFGVLIPLLHYFRLGNIINHHQAAQIVGTHFSSVKDKLLNILQLKEQSKSVNDASLIEASINQKIDDIKLVPFASAVNLSKNKQYLKYAIIPLFLLCCIFLSSPKIITESAARLIQNNTEFERAAPFQFTVNNEKLEVVQFEDITLGINVNGSVLPNEAFINLNGFPYKLKKDKPSEFSYQISKIQKDMTFYLEADGFKSKPYTISVIPKPSLINFDVALNYPKYIGKQNETIKNSGDMVLPAGTQIRWNFETQHADNIQLQFGDSKLVEAKTSEENHFSYARGVVKDVNYSVYLSNNRLPKADSINYNITVIPDMYPTISAQEVADTTQTGPIKDVFYFLGEAADDYGINKLTFNYKIENNDKNLSGQNQTLPIDIGSGGKSATSYSYTFDVSKIALKGGDRLNYYFEVWDNDGVNGNKSARTQVFSYQKPTNKELDKVAEKNNDELKKDMENVMKDAQKLKEEAKAIQEKLVQKKEMTWQDKSQMENVSKQYKDLMEKLEKMRDDYKQNINQQEEYKEFNKEIQEKQEKLEKMFDEMLSPEMKELMEKLQKLLEQLQKENTMEEMQNFELSNEQLKNEMDKMMELFKQLEFEQKMNETIDKLNELADKQEKLGDETEKKDNQDMKPEEKKQDEMKKEFEDIKKDVEDLQKKSEDLKKDMDLQKDTKQEQEDIKKEQEQSSEQMQQKSGKSASKKQKSAAKKMREMANKMQQAMMQSEQEQHEEDMQAIRQLLENLTKLSFDQEDLMENVGEADINTPQYVALMQQQHKLKDDFQLIEDSLIALSKRVFQLETFINKEVTEVKRNIKSSLENLETRSTRMATTNQQYTMTSVNNLALMLDEAMQQMQQQMAMKMPGNQSCEKPGGSGKPKPGKTGSAQKQLNDQIQKLQQDIKGGKMPGSQMSKEAAQLAAKQAAIRKALEQFNKDQNKGGGKEKGNLDDLARKMEQTEDDLVNKRITAETLKRQQEILNKLLESEKAERQQDQDPTRESSSAKQRERKTPPEIQEFLKKRQAEVELYKTVPPALKPYYKNLVEKYFKSISF